MKIEAQFRVGGIILQLIIQIDNCLSSHFIAIVIP